MRRLVSAALAAIVGLSAMAISPAPSNAQGLIVVTRVYSEVARNGCFTYVSQWSDGSYMVVPWICPYPVIPLRHDAPVPLIRSYQERGREGCLWFVSLWADGVFTGVPWSCPYGVVPIKPGTVPPPLVPWGPFVPQQPYFGHPGHPSYGLPQPYAPYRPY
ncbi:MAG: hypothetical protein KatS3mg060_1803 [Dehalococcoidia bacterium]|nr:MAG: hypothetical protein KatS3mg060_1803 [Dehalococcoidia bacterium]